MFLMMNFLFKYRKIFLSLSFILMVSLISIGLILGYSWPVLVPIVSFLGSVFFTALCSILFSYFNRSDAVSSEASVVKNNQIHEQQINEITHRAQKISEKQSKLDRENESISEQIRNAHLKHAAELVPQEQELQEELQLLALDKQRVVLAERLALKKEQFATDGQSFFSTRWNLEKEERALNLKQQRFLSEKSTRQQKIDAEFAEQKQSLEDRQRALEQEKQKWLTDARNAKIDPCQISTLSYHFLSAKQKQEENARQTRERNSGGM
jgi:hypothetical protein